MATIMHQLDIFYLAERADNNQPALIIWLHDTGPFLLNANNQTHFHSDSIQSSQPFPTCWQPV